MNTFTINKKKYTARAFDFNTVCELEDLGLPLTSFNGKSQLSMVRAYFAICSGMDIDEAGKELEAHLVNGGAINTILNAMTKELNDSGFFQALRKKTEETHQKTEE